MNEHTIQQTDSTDPSVESPGTACEITEFPEEPVGTLGSTTEIEQFYPDEVVGNIPPFPHLLRHPLKAAFWVIRMVFGIACLVLFLAIIAAVPIVNFIALGYLLDVEGRVARTGKIRLAFPLLDIAPRLGTIVIGVALWLIPLFLLAGAAADAHLIDPGGSSDRNLHLINRLAAIAIAVHLCLALARGGTFWCFVRPLKNAIWLYRQIRAGGYLDRAAGHVSDFFASLKLGKNFSLGLRGFLGALIWLIIPSAMFAAASSPEGGQGGAVAVTLLGGLILVIVLGWLPLLQAHFAAENRFRAMFELKTVRRKFKRSPLLWMLSLVIVYLLSLPLYLFKVAALPRDAIWGITLIFVATIYPTKILLGWVYHRASAKTKNAWFGWRWLSRTLILPLLAVYVFILFFTQFIGVHGNRVLMEHHLFLLPVPF
ncbi:DUF4013 domain-containing protein [Gimesia maris]|uniref:DUF4013 domain-containing protein n=1 Tax=Gimesia maris TaxID=122 RepID=UPI00241C63D9|nr:DUF4013 domain-containing protein [Gimesia maris]|tara:strand:- start:10227 stop:11507 length:1281 start_codon:yes stop_codon:yes gene_type:complete